MAEHKYKIGDRVRILHSDYSFCGLEIGTFHNVKNLKYNIMGDCLIGLDAVYDSGGIYILSFYATEIEPAPIAPVTKKIDIAEPLAAMKEFADACERAAAALDRIKEMMK